MKLNFLKISVVGLSVLSLAACSKWMTPEAEKFDSSYTETDRDDAYYEALRAYKASDHKRSFGWFDGWDISSTSPSIASSLAFIPDSMDIVSLWSNYGIEYLSPEKIEDLRFVTEVKGTKVLCCSFIWRIGDIYNPLGPNASYDDIKAHYGFVDGQTENNLEAISKWCADVAWFLNNYGFSGIDIDYEPRENPGEGNNDPIMPNATYFSHFVKEMGKYIGPQSGTGKIFCLDGYINTFPNPDELGKYFDYFVSQAYTRWGGGDQSSPVLDRSELDNRWQNFASHLQGAYPDRAELAKKFIVTDNLEAVDVCLAGGYFWKDEMGIWSRDVMPTLVGFAYWNPDEEGIRAGGFGAYKFGHERGNKPPYKWMRRAIQQANPSSPDVDVVTPEDYEPGSGVL